MLLAVYISMLLSNFLAPSEAVDDSRNELLYSIMNNTKISHCVLILDSVTSTGIYGRARFLAMRGISTNAFQMKNLKFIKTGTPQRRVAIVLDIDLGKNPSVIEVINKGVSARFVWILFATPHSVAQKDLFVPYDTEFYIVKNESESYYRIWEWYSFKNESWTNLVGTWSKNTLNMRTDFRKRRGNMTGLTLVGQLWNFCEESKVHCEALVLWNDFQRLFHFNAVYIRSDQTNTIKSYDLLVRVVPLVPKLMNIVIRPLFRFRLFATSRKLDEIPLATAYILPFDKLLWIIMALWVIVSALSFLLSSPLVKEKRKKDKKTYEFLEIVFAPIYTLLNQDCPNIPSDLTNRVVMLATRLVSVVVMIHYSAFLITYVMLARPEFPFNTMQGFLEQDTYKMLMIKSSLERIIFYTYHQVHKSNKFKEVENVEEGILKICSDKYVLATTGHLNVFGSSACTTKEIENYLWSVNTGIHCRRRELLTFFNQRIILFRETGILTKMQNNVEGLAKIYDGLEEEMEPVEISHVVSILYLLALSKGLSLVYLILEIGLGFRARCSSLSLKRFFYKRQ